MQVFQEAVQYWSRLQQQGEIKSFEPVALEPHGGELGGFCLIKGDRDRLGRLRYSEAWQRLNTPAQSVIQQFGVVDAHIGEGLQQLVGAYQQATQELAGPR